MGRPFAASSTSAFLLILLYILTAASPLSPSLAFPGRAFNFPSKNFPSALLFRGGSDTDSDVALVDEDDDDEAVTISDTESEPEEEEEKDESDEQVDAPLASSLKSKTTSTKSKGPSLLSRIPTPAGVLAVLRLYFKSLFNPSFPTLYDLDLTPAANLRSSLERSNRRKGGGEGGRRVKKMKRGKAKTLSDLPKLNS